MSEHTPPTVRDPHDPLSDIMIAWLKLRREMEDRITDPDLLALFHEFMQVDQALFEEESREAFEWGASTRKA